MTKANQNTILAFVWAAVALLALYVLPASLDSRASVCDSTSYESVYLQVGEKFVAPSRDLGQNQPCDSYLDDAFSRSKTAAFWGSRRLSTQMTLRPQRGRLLYRLLGRDGALYKSVGLRSVKNFAAFVCKNVGFPSPLSYSVPKEYYVFTLRRILC